MKIKKMSYHTAQLKGKTFQYRTAAGEQSDGSRVHQVIWVDWLIQSCMEWWRGKLRYVSAKHNTKKCKANDNKASSADDLEPCLISHLNPAALRCSIKWSCKNASKNNISLTVIQKFGDETVTFFSLLGPAKQVLICYWRSTQRKLDTWNEVTLLFTSSHNKSSA